MEKSFQKILNGYQDFRNKYASGDASILKYLSYFGQEPEVMVVACCDSRVDPALILQCEPGDLFVVRNVANIIPPYEKDAGHHGTSAALEFGINFLKVKHLILFGHSQCGGIQALLNNKNNLNSPESTNDFINNWVSIIKKHPRPSHLSNPDDGPTAQEIDQCAKLALNESYQNCLGFPWIREKIKLGELIVHRWFFEIETGQIFTYSALTKSYEVLG